MRCEAARSRLRAVLLLATLLILAPSAPSAAAESEWIRVGTLAVRDISLLAGAADRLFPNLATGTDAVTVVTRRTLAEIADAGATSLTGRLLVASGTAHVALVLTLDGGHPRPESAEAIASGVVLARTGALLALLTDEAPPLSTDGPPIAFPGTAEVAAAIDWKPARDELLAALRGRDLDIRQRAAIEEVVAPLLAAYAGLRFEAGRDPDGWSARLALATDGDSSEYARFRALNGDGNITALAPRAGLAAWFYDLDDHAANFRGLFSAGAFLQMVRAQGTAGAKLSDELERACGAKLDELPRVIGHELFVAIHAAPAGQELSSLRDMPGLTLALTLGDEALFAKAAAAFGRIALTFAMPVTKIYGGCWALDLDRLLPNPFVSKVYLARAGRALLATTRLPEYGTTPLDVGTTATGEVLAAAGDADLGLLKIEIDHLATRNLLSFSGAADLLAYLNRHPLTGTARFAIRYRPDGMILDVRHTKGDR